MKTAVYRLPEVCDKLDISESTAHRLIRRGVAPFTRAFKVGHTWRIPAADIDGRVSKLSEVANATMSPELMH